MSDYDLDYEKILEIPIAEVAEKWGVDLHRKGKNAVFYCPNPDHDDNHLGNCCLTLKGSKNMFCCYACGAGGSSIELVYYLENLAKKYDYKHEAKQAAAILIAKAFGLIKNDMTPVKKSVRGLKLQDYEDYFKLSKAYIEQLTGKPKGYSIKDLKYDDPFGHDYVLTCRFEEKYFAYNRLIERIKNGELLIFGDIFMPSDEWINIILEKQKILTQKYLKALKNAA